MPAMNSTRSCDADWHQQTLNRPYREQCVGSLARVDLSCRELAQPRLLPALSKAEGPMSKNHTQDRFRRRARSQPQHKSAGTEDFRLVGADARQARGRRCPRPRACHAGPYRGRRLGRELALAFCFGIEGDFNAKAGHQAPRGQRISPQSSRRRGRGLRKFWPTALLRLPRAAMRGSDD